MLIRPITSDHDVRTAFPLMAELRPALRADEFLAAVRAQERDGYRLLGGYAGDGPPVCLAGYRVARTLSRGPHLFVDDLVTAAAHQKRGHGTAMLAHLARLAIGLGLPDVWLDSRSTATGFYAQLGFELKRGVPCVMPAAALARRDAGVDPAGR